MSKITSTKRQVVECLPSKHETCGQTLLPFVCGSTLILFSHDLLLAHKTKIKN
jgi:hypothetical protein